MRTLLLDSDILAYEFAAKSERKYEWDEGEITRVADPIEEVCEKVSARVWRLKRELKADDVIVCLSDPVLNFRKVILPSYKANRVSVIKPEHLFPVKDFLATEFRSFIRPTLEADDIMGILATHPTLVPGEKVIVSEDKDMGQIPGLWFNPRKAKLRRVTAEEGELLHMTQALTGDSVDNYKGCPGIGAVRAEAILDQWYGPEADEVYKAECAWRFGIVPAYKAKGLTEEDALVQARVAKILQFTDYDFKRKEPKLWNPPTE